jgi:Predicted S-adenosylmethionine-dependent methyltransferase involved in cell envelope biogenesis
MSYTPQHIPVLLDEVVNALSINNHEYYIDATFGLGGYTKAILNLEDCKVIAFDRDPVFQFLQKKLKLMERQIF